MIALAALVLSACGATPGSSSSDGAGDQPTTARALASVVEDHLADRLGKATSARPGLDGPRAVGGVGAELRFRSTEESSNPGVALAVGTKARADEFTCAKLESASYSGCVATDGGVLFWEEGSPEEDPGVVYVAVRKGEATVLMFLHGPNISGDPRHLKMRISVKDLFDIAKDPKVDVTTPAGTIRAGQRLKSWTDKP